MSSCLLPEKLQKSSLLKYQNIDFSIQERHKKSHISFSLSFSYKQEDSFYSKYLFVSKTELLLPFPFPRPKSTVFHHGGTGKNDPFHSCSSPPNPGNWQARTPCRLLHRLGSSHRRPWWPILSIWPRKLLVFFIILWFCDTKKLFIQDPWRSCDLSSMYLSQEISKWSLPSETTLQDQKTNVISFFFNKSWLSLLLWH